MSGLRLSVIVPAYNVAEYIEECLDSILNNGYENIEVVVVNDGSTDTTAAILDKYASNDHVNVFHKSNGGLSDARNYGIANSTGDYITFVDGDDVIDKGTYGAAMCYLANNPSVSILQFPMCCGWLSGHERVKSGDGKIHDDLKDVFELQISEDISYSSCNKIYKKSQFNGYAFPVGKLHEDMYVIPQLLRDAGQIYLSNEGMYNYRFREGSITRSGLSFKRLSDLLVAYEEIASITMTVGVDRAKRRLFLFEIFRLVALYYDSYSAEERKEVFKLLRRIKLLKNREILQSLVGFEISLRKNLVLYYSLIGRYDKVMSKFKNR